MGYAAEKRAVEEKIRIRKRIVAMCIFVCIAALCVLSFVIPFPTWKYRVALPNVGVRGEGELRIHFVDVGQGDCTIIELPDGKVAIVDGGDGNNAAKKAVMRYLNALKADRVDYMIVTHADSDHVGGLEEVLKYKEVGKLFLPTVKEGCDEYEKLFAAALEKKVAYCTICPPSTQNAETALSVTDGAYPYTLSFIYPHAMDVNKGAANFENDNAASGVLWLDYLGVSTLFTGDAPKATEERLIFDSEAGLLARYGVELTSTEILKVAHHGSADSTGLAFLEYIHADTAVISCGKDNAYGHPTVEVLDNLTRTGAGVYRTDIQGSIIITVDKDGNRSVYSPT